MLKLLILLCVLDPTEKVVSRLHARSHRINQGGTLVTAHRHKYWANKTTRLRLPKAMKTNYLQLPSRIAQEKWWYSDEASWPGEECRFGSARQSPIDIRTRRVIIDRTGEFVGPKPLRLTGYTQTLVTALNNGHTVQLTTEGPESMHPRMTGGPLRHVYRLEQIHFHSLSEHAIDGIKFPMEIHFVHIRADLSVQEALNAPDGLAIMAVFCNVFPDRSVEDFTAAEEIMQFLPSLRKTNKRISGALIDLSMLFSPNLNSYYSYAGSLTTPECNEAVIWLIFDKPIKLSEYQYQQFGKIGKETLNARSIQVQGRQKVYRRPSEEATPTVLVIVQRVLKQILKYFKNMKQVVEDVVSDGVI